MNKDTHTELSTTLYIDPANADLNTDWPQVDANDNYEITAEELLNRKVESIPCLIEPIIQQVGLAAVAGSSDVGKSAFLRQLAFAVASGEPDFLGFPIRAKHRSAIYVSTEDDEQATSYLLNSLNKIRKRTPADCAPLRFIFDTHDLPAQLDKRLTARPADLVVIDAFGDLYGKDQNSSNQIRAFLHEYSQLAQKHQCLFLFLHHVGKRTEDEAPSKHHLIGGQGFEGKMRLVIELRLDLHDPARRHLCLVKGNYLPSEWKQDSFVLDFQNFLFSNTGDRVPFESLARPKDGTRQDEGKARYEQIQQARQLGYKGDPLAQYLNWSKSYISQIEKKFGPKEPASNEFTESL